MAIIKCKMCGGDLNIVDDTRVCECEYCGTKQTVPSADNEKKLTLFGRAGRLLRACEFDKAAGVFETIVADFPQEAEAYWGLLLCEYGIEYVDDPVTGSKVPTCHRSSFDSVEDNTNFEQACENADAVARRIYREEARQIETLRKRILEVSGQEESYDVFISYKELDEDGDRTPDSVIAQDIYRALIKEGYRVFFARISLEGKLGVEYEPYIFAALNSAKVMIVVGTDYEYFNAVWVKNEWSRFLKLIASGQQKTVIPVYKDMDPYDMPKELRLLAAQNMGKIGAMQDLLHGVEKLLGKTNEQAPKEQPVIVQSGGPNVQALLDRGNMELEDEEWEKAKELFDQVLNMDSRNAEAYLGPAMAEEEYQNREALFQAYVKPHAVCRNNKRLVRARQFSTGNLRIKFQTLDDIGHTQDLVFDLVFALKQIRSMKKKEIERLEQERREEEKRQAKMKAAESLRFQREKRNAAKLMIAAEYDHTVGLKADGTVVAVGENDKGQCNVSSWTDIVAVAAGAHHTVGLKADGTVVATKHTRTYANTGQCEVGDWRDIVAVAAGRDHTAGLKANGTVVATPYRGDQKYYTGQCEVGDWRDIVAVAAGEHHTVGLKADGTVVATKYTGAHLNTDQCEIGDWRDIVAVAAGDYRTVGLKADGTVVAVGSNYDGECEVGNWRDIVAVAAGAHHTVGLKADGTVVATKNTGAYFNTGQCEVGDWRDIVAVAAGDYHTVGLKADGTVVATTYRGDQKYYSGQCEVSGWKLFDNFETIVDERKVAIEKADAKRKAAAERVDAKRKAAAERVDAKRKAAAERAEAERKAKIADLNKEKADLQVELPTIKGLFSGGKRREIESRLHEIEAELKKLE